MLAIDPIIWLLLDVASEKREKLAAGRSQQDG